MRHDRISVVWPAPGFPACCAGDARVVTVIAVHCGTGSEDLHGWAGGWHVRHRQTARRIPLVVQQLSTPSGDQPLPEVSEFAALPEHRRLRYAVIEMTAADPLGMRDLRSAVFDLVSPRGIERPRSVAWFADGGELQLAFASDIHVATLWDEVADVIHRYAPDLAPRMAHPGTHLRRFVEDVNDLARRGQVDAVVFGGDLIDHVYTQPRGRAGGGFDDTNLRAFLDGVDRLAVPSFIVPGNHDYRLYPWRPRAYGLRAARVPAARLRALLERAGWWDRWPLRWSDLDALATETAGLGSPLNHHLTHVSPSTNFMAQIGSTRLVFLDSGRDVVPRWRSVHRSRYPLLVRSLPGSWIDPDSEGLSDEQLRFLETSLSGSSGAAVFCHAPLLASATRPIAEVLSRLEAERPDSDLAFERQLARCGARCGVLFHNPGPLIRLLKRLRAPLTWFGGHVHRRGGFSMDRQTGAVRDLAQPHDDIDGDCVDFVQTPSLGLHGTRPQDDPGYLLAVLRRGRLEAHRYCGLDPSA
jgi:hypothetical protein